VNTNFSIWRGHLIPLDGSLAAAATNTYDLGSTDYQWRNLYLQNSPIINGQGLGSKLYMNRVNGGESAPYFEYKGEQPTMQFAQSADTDIVFSFPVIAGYSAGNLIKAELFFYTDTDTSGFDLQADVSLFTPNTNTANTSTVADVQTFTTSISMATNTANITTLDTTLNFCATGGSINSASVTSDQFLGVRLSRKGTNSTDTMTGSLYLNHINIDFNG